MAVYTHVSAEAAHALLLKYDVGSLTAIKGIAEGVQNSNFLLETDQSRFILTLYESRVELHDLPYFHAMLAHLHASGCKVPRFIEDRDGNWLQDIAGRKGCLIEFLQGVSLTTPSPNQAYAVGQALGAIHNALQDFAMSRPNPLGVKGWRALFDTCGPNAADDIVSGLSSRIGEEIGYVEQNWPDQLPVSAIHADLFPDNVLTLGDDVTGLIDFYFACNDVTAYDLAVTHTAWCFDANGENFRADVSQALISGYETERVLSGEEREAFPVLARGACLRFLLTRLYDWINTPATALVTRKDPLAFLRRLDYYCSAETII